MTIPEIIADLDRMAAQIIDPPDNVLRRIVNGLKEDQQRKASALQTLEEIRTEKLAAGGFAEEATAVSAARAMLRL